MATNGPDPSEFLEKAQRMLRELFGDPGGGEEPWGAATRRAQAPHGNRERSSERQR
jgi:hypothetical protein